MKIRLIREGWRDWLKKNKPATAPQPAAPAPPPQPAAPQPATPAPPPQPAVPLESAWGPLTAELEMQIRPDDARALRALTFQYGKIVKTLGSGIEGIAYLTDHDIVMKLFWSAVAPHYDEVTDDKTGLAPHIEPYKRLAQHLKPGYVHVFETYQSKRDDRYAIAVVVMEKLENLDSLYDISPTISQHGMDMRMGRYQHDRRALERDIDRLSAGYTDFETDIFREMSRDPRRLNQARDIFDREVTWDGLEIIRQIAQKEIGYSPTRKSWAKFDLIH